MFASFLYIWILKKLHTNITQKPLSALQSVSSLIIFNWWARLNWIRKKMDGWSLFYSISSTLCHSANFLMWLSSKYFAFTRIRLVLISQLKRVNINKTDSSSVTTEGSLCVRSLRAQHESLLQVWQCLIVTLHINKRNCEIVHNPFFCFWRGGCGFVPFAKDWKQNCSEAWI